MFFHSMNFSIGEDNEALRETVFKFAQKTKRGKEYVMSILNLKKFIIYSS